MSGMLAAAAELARWDAADPARAGGLRVVHQPENDYYRRSAYLVHAGRPVKGPVWLIVEYADRGYAWITASPGVPMQNQHGVVRLDTGRNRRAVFRYDQAVFPSAIRIEGAGQVRSVSLSDAAPSLDPVPEVKPALEFRTPSQRVISAADIHRPEDLPEALATLRNLLPLARALGFNAIEFYVRWGLAERARGVYDWSLYDALVAEIERQGLQFFPLLIGGSGYALPKWFHDSPENVGFECLEHRVRHDVQSIFCENQTPYVRRFLAEFGKHYGSRKALQGVRLGPSGDYGEAQYPARGPGYQFRAGHTHIGYWAADPFAQLSLRAFLRGRYPDVASLNNAWSGDYRTHEDVSTFLPVTSASPRKRIDFGEWYMGAMSDWCEKWAVWTRQAMPNTVIHQSSGGWGPVEIGTDYSFQARSMAKVKGGVRLTNESDNYADNFTITRMASSAARFYGAGLGYEPGGFGSARGVMARLYNAVTNGAEHLFYYHSNLYSNDQAIDRWLAHAHLLDRRAKPVIDVAVFYPDTAIKLDDDVLRYRWASAFLTKAQALRSEMDYDYLSEQMIEDGALDRFKALVWLWGTVTEKRILERMDRWVRAGGAVIYPAMPRGLPVTVEGDGSIAANWQRGETGKGRAVAFHGDTLPGQQYARFIRREVLKLDGLAPAYRSALAMRKPPSVYWSTLANGLLVLLNFDDEEAEVRLEGGKSVSIAPYSIAAM